MMRMSRSRLEMGGANGVRIPDQRRSTDMAILMPGVTNNETKNNESDEPMVVNGNSQSTEMYIEGLPLESASVSGDPRYIWFRHLGRGGRSVPAQDHGLLG